MTPLRSYLIRAIYEWIVDNSMTPYLLVNTEDNGTIVPDRFVQDGKIVLNLKPEAIQDLTLGNTNIEFSARFGGAPTQVIFPVAAVLAIYARENGKGMIFDQDDGDLPPSDSGPGPFTDKSSKPVLKVVK